MEIKKKGAFFTLTALVMVSILFLAAQVSFMDTTGMHASVIHDRISSIDYFVQDLERDIERGALVAAQRGLLGVQQQVTSEGYFLNDTNDALGEIIIDGTYNGTYLSVMNDTELNSWLERINSQANKLSIEVDYDISNLTVEHLDPWHIEIDFTAKVNVSDMQGISTWERKKQITENLSIIGFEDPLYNVKTKGQVPYTITPTTVTDFVVEGNASGLLEHVDMGYYKRSEYAPSFLMRLEGNLSHSTMGIESIVDLRRFEAIGISTKNKSVIDHIYFSDQDPETWVINNTYSWLRIDNQSQTTRLDEYMTGEPQPEPFYEIDIVSTNAPIDEGETLVVEVKINNSGDIAGEQNIRLLDFNGQTVETKENIQVNTSEEKTIKFEWNTSLGDGGEDKIIVKSDDSQDEKEVEIKPASVFEITSLDVNSPVTEGQTLEVNVEIENTGSETGIRKVELFDFTGNKVDSEESAELDAGESQVITLEWNTNIGDGEETGDIEVKIYEETQDQEVTIEIIEYTLTWNIDGEGEVFIDKQWHSSDGSEEFERDTNIDLNASPDESLDYIFSRWDSDDLYSESDNETITMDSDKIITAEFEEGHANFEVDITGTNSPVNAGDELQVYVEVENTGDATGEQDITLIDFTGSEVYSESLELDAGDSDTITLFWTTTEDDMGIDDVSAESEDDSDFEEVEIHNPDGCDERNDCEECTIDGQCQWCVGPGTQEGCEEDCAQNVDETITEPDNCQE